MSKYMPIGMVTGLFSGGSVLAGYFGFDELAKMFSDAKTVQNVMVVLGALGAFAGGFLPGVRRSAEEG